jgi:small subunit ribosomal protein S21
MNYYNRQEKGGICVVRKKNESDEAFLRRFRKKFSKSGIMKEYKEKMYFEKPSDKKRRKRAQAAQVRRQDEEKREKFQKKQEKYNRKMRQKNAKRREKYDTSSRR